MNKTKLDINASHPLQTSYWGEFRKKTGNIIYQTDEFQLTIHPIPFFPQYKVGALIKGPKPTSKLLDNLKTIGKKENLIFIKMEPNILKNDKDISLLKNAGAVPGKTLFTPTTFWIDLNKSEEELLKNFHSKTRYNIKVALKHGVKVSIDNSDKAFEKYLRLTKETAQRQGFYAHSERYHRLMWETLKDKMAHLLVARYKGKIIATWILFVWRDFLYYPYGASTEEHKNVMASSLMMWEAIRFGKKLKLTTFDLWGREEGKGFTKFKEGFSPKVVEFLGTWDLVINPTLYKIYILADKLRWQFLRLKTKFISPKF